MCGIAGFTGPEDHDLLAQMTERIVHRGPDDEGFYETGALSLGFRRLSILDLDHGHQPMSSPDAAMHLVYNGEVYNYRELRSELEALGATFSTNCDTEVVLAAFAQWDVGCFARFNGMWALAVLDARRADGAPRLVLARDHFGIKPLYLRRSPDRWWFASEIKALLADPTLAVEPNRLRVAEYLVEGLHDHDTATFFEGIEQLAAGSYAELDLADPTGELVVHRYYTPRLSTSGSSDPARFREVFSAAIERRLIADVTVGTCLSGGLDSSSIACVIAGLKRAGAPDAASLGSRLKTFSAVFDGDPIDEQAYIAPVLTATGAAGNFVRPQAAELFEDLPLVVWHQDEPMVSSGPYAQYRVMELAQGHAKVLLDGQGGDELLAGYVPYQYVYVRQLLHDRKLGLAAREAAAASDVIWPLARRQLADRAKAFDPAAYCHEAVRSALSASAPRSGDRRRRDQLKARLLQDFTSYSLPALLRYEDRNSMAFSIESRPPFLDQELVSFICDLPETAIVNGGWSRAILREALRGQLPEIIRTRRKKIGFTTPEIRWLRTERARIQGLFRSPAFVARGIVRAPELARAFVSACDGTLEESPFFWRALNLEVWWRVFCAPEPARISLEGRRPQATQSIEHAGDVEAVLLAGTETAREFLEAAKPRPGRHRFCCDDEGRRIFGRAPVRCRRIEAGDDLQQLLGETLRADPIGLRSGDCVAVSEKAVAIAQGRSFPVSEVRVSRLARALSRFVQQSPAGIGLGIPATMQLAIEQAGVVRVLLGAAVAACTKPLGVGGWFYRIAGEQVAAIDGPTPGTLPPYNTHAKLAPADPDGVAERLAHALGSICGGPVSVAVIDANDRGVKVLGASRSVDRALVAWLFADNPLGQGHEQTPFAVVREVGALASA